MDSLKKKGAPSLWPDQQRTVITLRPYINVKGVGVYLKSIQCVDFMEWKKKQTQNMKRGVSSHLKVNLLYI